jgi:hypothetical protein
MVTTRNSLSWFLLIPEDSQGNKKYHTTNADAHLYPNITMTIATSAENDHRL